MHAWRTGSRWGAVVFVGCLGVTAFACEDGGGSSSGGPGVNLGEGGVTTPPLGPGEPATAGTGNDFCDRTLGVVVRALEACCTAEDKTTPDYGITHGISAALLPRCSSALEDSIAKRRVVYRAAEGKACFDAYAATYAPGKCETITQTYADPSGPSCRQAFAGLGEIGEACGGDHECVDGLTCIGYAKAANGTCSTPPPVGSDCGPSNPDGGAGGGAVLRLDFGIHPPCADGGRCDLFTRKCVATGKSGEACSTSDGCEDPLHCVLGKCAASRGADGVACRDGDDCEPGLFCDVPIPPTGPSAEGTCRPRRSAGEACTGATFVSSCAGRCAATPGQPGTCARFCGSR